MAMSCVIYNTYLRCIVMAMGNLKFPLTVAYFYLSFALCGEFLVNVPDEDLDTFEGLNLVQKINGGWFIKGVNDPNSKTGEYPVHKVRVRPFYLDRFPVTNARFWKFKKLKKSLHTEAERRGWSWVFKNLASDEAKRIGTASGDPWWIAVKNANWIKPLGPDTFNGHNLDNPVVHVSLLDAEAFCFSEGKRLPTEDEWEFAARGGYTNYDYPWGEIYRKNRANLWQGAFPDENKKIDGYVGLSPVDAFPPQNAYGLYDILGNVWEWTRTPYRERGLDSRFQEELYVVKGGSYIDTWDASANFEVRNSQRTGFPPSYSAHNLGFRCLMEIPYIPPKPPQRIHHHLSGTKPLRHVEL